MQKTFLEGGRTQRDEHHEQQLKNIRMRGQQLVGSRKGKKATL